MRRTRWSTAIGMVLAVSAPIGLVACEDDAASEPASQSEAIAVAEGVQYTTFEYAADGGGTQVHLLTVDLSAPGVGVDVLTPGAVTQTARPSTMAEAAGAIAVINGDFFNNADDQQVGAPTNAPVGPAIVSGQHLKGAVPDKQRQGPDRPVDDEIDDIDSHPGVTSEGLRNNQTVFGITTDGVAAVSELRLEGTISTATHTFTLAGLNQYAIPEHRIGLYTHEWGLAERVRAVCGVDEDRNGPCDSSAFEFTVTDGTVTDFRDLGGGAIVATKPLEAGQAAIVARGASTHDLARVRVGDRITWEYELVAPDGLEFAAAIGGSPLVLGGAPVGGLDDSTSAPRTAVGHSADGGTLYLVVVDGRSTGNWGATMSELASIMIDAGAVAAVNLDGGGSSVMATADQGGDDLTVRNTPSDGIGWFRQERPVANALAIFATAGAEADDRNAPGGSDPTEAPGEAHPLEGRWEVVATSPGQASTLVFDSDGNATYTTEGTFVAYWSGTVRAEADSTFMVDFLPSEDSIYEEYGDDADISDWLFTMHFELDSDGETLTTFGEYGGTQYVKVSD